MSIRKFIIGLLGYSISSKNGSRGFMIEIWGRDGEFQCLNADGFSSKRLEKIFQSALETLKLDEQARFHKPNE